jgi:UDP-galactopyranose mutase
MSLARPIVVFSHLRWDFVYQRPQHLMSRLAANRPVVFVEEPLAADGGGPSLETSRPAPGLLVARPRIPGAEAGFSRANLPAVERLVRGLLAAEEITDPVAWLYTPMALPLAGAIGPSAVVYDCMDELSLFLGAPPELLRMEAALLERADVVFTGGVSLYRAKRDRHPNVHCFPSSVDAAHFRRARADQAGDAAAPEPADQAALPRPRLGFFGVIDERLDAALVDALARSHPEWQIVLVGPVIKIDPATLPRHPGVHYLGQRAYAELPGYLSGWDVCLLPFARNEATRFISPTKTLEYMAAERPIVSTPIADVAEPYGDIVYLADTPEAFVRACERALAAPAEERRERAERMRRVLAGTSWDATAAAMERLVAQAVEANARRQRARPAAARPSRPTPTSSALSSPSGEPTV